MARRRTAPRAALFGALVVLPACGMIIDIQPLTVEPQRADVADAGPPEEADVEVALDAPPDAVCSMKTTPLLLPGTADQRDDPSTHLSWDIPDRIKADDNLPASVSGGFVYTRELLASSFHFAIPASAKILGVTVQVKVVRAGGSGWGGEGVTLEPQDAGSTRMSQTQPYDATAYTVRQYGGPGELWGLALDPATVNQDSFGVDFQAQHGNPFDGPLSVDFIKMAITYLSCE